VFVAAAVCPHPPLLVPEAAAGAAAELDDLRAACDTAVRAVLGALPDLVVILGDAPGTGEYPRDACGSLRPYGVAVSVGLTENPGPPVLPLAHTVGAWLLRRAGWPGDRLAYGLSAAETVGGCQRIGAALAASADRVGLLVMGDGSARRSEKAPGYLDPEAGAFDAAVARALGEADGATLAGIDPVRARGLLAAGRASWQALSGAAEGTGCAGKLLYHEAPYGVGYFVAIWA
jgi:hypothetical protein